MRDGVFIPSSLRLRNSKEQTKDKSSACRWLSMKKDMRRVISISIIWGCRLASIIVALWWPAFLHDPIFTPRHTRLTGQELALPNGAIPQTTDDRAMAIFWMWEQRTLVKDPWQLGPYRGLRDASGRNQTLVVIACIWLLRGGFFLWERSTPSPSHSP